MSPHPALPERLKRSRGTDAPLAWADGPGKRGRGDAAVRIESKPRCPFCRSNDTEVISLFGSQVMTMQCKCRACGSFFEASKY
jgi:hypothetical protein